MIVQCKCFVGCSSNTGLRLQLRLSGPQTNNQTKL